MFNDVVCSKIKDHGPQRSQADGKSRYQVLQVMP